MRECRDPKDDKYLALAAAGPASVIVSSDVRHLLSMHPWRGIPTLSPAAFCDGPECCYENSLVPHRGRAAPPALIGVVRLAANVHQPGKTILRRAGGAPASPSTPESAKRLRLSPWAQRRCSASISTGANCREGPSTSCGRSGAVNLLAFASVVAGACRVYCAAVAMLAVPTRRTVPP